MSTLKLPRPTHQQPPRARAPSPARPALPRAAPAHPPYGARARWRPRAEADFADGGAFPECHVAQYPRGLGRARRAARVALGQADAESAAARALVPAGAVARLFFFFFFRTSR